VAVGVLAEQGTGQLGEQLAQLGVLLGRQVAQQLSAGFASALAALNPLHGHAGESERLLMTAVAEDGRLAAVMISTRGG
jgi:hypothetical protein